MPVEHVYPDMPLPTSLIIEPILLQHRVIVMKPIKNHGGRLDANEAFFPQGTIKRFIWPRILDWRYSIIFPDGYEIFPRNELRISGCHWLVRLYLR